MQGQGPKVNCDHWRVALTGEWYLNQLLAHASVNIRQKTLIGLLSFVAFLSTTSAVYAQSNYYKGFYYGNCTYYAAIQFDQRAPSPGVNWRGNASAWLNNAQAAGWLTSNLICVNSAPNGTIAVWDDGGYGHVAVVRYWNSAGLQIDEMNWYRFNVVDSRWLTWQQAQRIGKYGQYRLVGFIFPWRR